MSLIRLQDLSAGQLRRAVHIKEQIESLESELSALLDGPSPSTVGKSIRRRRRMSASARAKIAAAAKKRWAKFRAAKKSAG